MQQGIPWGRLSAEGSVIVVSILLALGGQAWWEGRQERRQEDEYLVALRAELDQGLAMLPAAVAEVDDVLHAHESLIAQFGATNLAPSDSLIYWLSQLSYPTGFTPPRAVLEDLVSSGGIRLITSDRLRLAVADYDRALGSIAATSQQAWTTWSERIQPYLEPRVSRVDRLRKGSYFREVPFAEVPFAPSPFIPNYGGIFSDPGFESMIAERWIRLDSSIATLSGLDAVIAEIVAMIDEELHGPSR